ncbi:hypothetical protein [Pyrobaculum sp.]|jgi:hypothetical protein|uniref:hypothetical protein n=1 Tax=Pyrobaculum sp. TaxID=2004705 RepID=UPI003D13068A
MQAVADTCFLLDWVKFSRRDLLFDIFTTVWLPEPVLGEVRSEDTLTWISERLAQRKLSLIPELPELRARALSLMTAVASRLSIPLVDYPEAYCLEAGRELGAVVLTENRGALAVPRILPEYSGVVVWRSLEVLAQAVRLGKADCGVFDRYREEALHEFPRRDLEKILNEVGCRDGGGRGRGGAQTH